MQGGEVEISFDVEEGVVVQLDATSSRSPYLTTKNVDEEESNNSEERERLNVTEAASKMCTTQPNTMELQEQAMPMLVSLTDCSPSRPAANSIANATGHVPPVELVGGKASSLAKLYGISGLSGHVPKAFALTVDFFRGWVESVVTSSEWTEVKEKYGEVAGEVGTASVNEMCKKLKETCHSLPLSADQADVLEKLRQEMGSWGTGVTEALAAVRSSAPEEDGGSASFAGAFETKLGVSVADLEAAVRECFASLFDSRVFSYSSSRYDGKGGVAFAAVVMEMVDSDVAGVAFSANPLNSDRDELCLDSSYGLGESVVDGSIESDHIIWDKIGSKILTRTIGSKKQEKRLKKSTGGGIETIAVEESRQKKCTLSDKQIEELAGLVCLVETAYGIPMDVEWAYTSEAELKLLQARPITSIFQLDANMITAPGEPRVLYYDFNIASEATTTSAFTHMDISMFSRLGCVVMGIPDINMFKEDPRMPLFNGETRQYMNLSIFFKFISPKTCAKYAETMDPHLASIFASSECSRKRYRSKNLPKEVNMKNTWFIARSLPLMKMYKMQRKFSANPERAKQEYLAIIDEDMKSLQRLESRGMVKQEGLQKYSEELVASLMSSFNEEFGAINTMLPMFQRLDKKRRDRKSTEEKRNEYDALCGGYEGDELMQMNIEMYRLARKLPESIWAEYCHDELQKLARRIESNIEGVVNDIPQDFLAAWNLFLEKFGWDGQDQVFVSSERYKDSPVFLLARLRHSAGDNVKDPAMIQHEQLARRRKVMELHEARAKRKHKPFALKKVQKRNGILDHIMWIRNAPKLHISRAVCAMRQAALQVQAEFIANERLEAVGDIFHLCMEEVDEALKDDSLNLKGIVRPRKMVYERATKATVCPLLIDSRCRILKPDPPAAQGDHEPGTLIGSAISPGVATGKVRIMHNPTDQFENGEILAATVTSPAWTPLFVGAAAIILQIGGVLQHGALCAREYGKPAVSNIDVMTDLKTGMRVSVDGNTGIVKIITEEESDAL